MPGPGERGNGPLERAMRQCRSNVDAHGWHVTCVLGRPHGYAYTTGLWARFRHPELVVAALPPPAAFGVLAAAARMAAVGRPLDDHTQHPGVIEGYPVRVRAVDAGQCTTGFGVCTAYYRSPVPVRQVIWPGRDGRFPGEPGADPAVTAAQDITAGRPRPAGLGRRPGRSAVAANLDAAPRGFRATGGAAWDSGSGDYAMFTRAGNQQAAAMVRAAQSMCRAGRPEAGVAGWLRAERRRIATAHPEITDVIVQDTVAYALDEAWQAAYGHPSPG